MEDFLFFGKGNIAKEWLDEVFWIIKIEHISNFQKLHISHFNWKKYPKGEETCNSLLFKIITFIKKLHCINHYLSIYFF